MKKFIALLLLITFSACLFANTNTTPEPYGDDEFPDWAKLKDTSTNMTNIYNN